MAWRKYTVILALAAGTLIAAGGVAFAQSHADGSEFVRAAEDVFDGVLLDFAPEPLLKRGPYRVLWAQWLATPVLLIVAWLAGVALSRTTRALLRPVVQRTATRWDDALIERMSAPLTLAWMLIAGFFLVQLLGLRPAALDFAFQILRAGWVMCFFWVLGRAVDVTSHVLAASTFGPGVSARRALLPLIARVAKLVVVALAIVALMSELGYSVASILAGLGVGGLAVALAAQKTFEHWFGALAIAVDQPFREGDFVKVDGVQGNIEQIGMRSTRIRTLDRTIISIPNGKLADMQPETFAARDRIRLACDLRLVYGSSSAQVRDVLAGIESTLRAQPKLRADSVSVILRELATFALVIEVIAAFDTSDVNEFNQIRQALLLAFMEVVERAGTKLALPSQRVEVVGDDAARARAVSDTRELSARGS